MEMEPILPLSLNQIVQLLQHPSPYVAENAGAYLQHLSFQNEEIKAEIQVLGGIPILICLLSNSQSRVRRRASSVLRNLSFGHATGARRNMIKQEIVSVGGIEVFLDVLKTTIDNKLKEDVTGILWNLSSCPELKEIILQKAGESLVKSIIIPLSGYDSLEADWSNVLFRNASGVLKNISSTEGNCNIMHTFKDLQESFLHIANQAYTNEKYDGSKSTENCIAIIRNLTYRCCKDSQSKQRNRILCKPETISIYLKVFSGCSNFRTVEGAAGIIQNLTANHQDVREAVFNINGVGPMVKLLIFVDDQVVGTVAHALRNLIVDKRNKYQIGTFAITCISQKLSGESEASEHTLMSLLGFLNELIKNNPTLSTFLAEADGIKSLLNIKNNSLNEIISELAGQVLMTLWNQKKLRSTYKSLGWSERDFLDNKTKKVRSIVASDGKIHEYKAISNV